MGYLFKSGNSTYNGTYKRGFSSIEYTCNYPLGTMNPIDSEVQIIVIDALQYELVSDVDASGLKIVPHGSGYNFAGRLVVVMADGSVVHLDCTNSGSVSEGGNILLLF